MPARSFLQKMNAIGPWPYRGRNGLSAAVILALSTACGSSSGPTTPSSPNPPPGPSGPPTVTIRATGVTPREITVAVGERVLFVNSDTVPHDVAGGPEPARPDCLEIDAVGFLTPGQARQTAPLPVARTCDYHDHGFHSPLFNGRIIIR